MPTESVSRDGVWDGIYLVVRSAALELRHDGDDSPADDGHPDLDDEGDGRKDEIDLGDDAESHDYLK